MVIRPRRPDDVGGLVDLLAAQQPHSLYPLMWPLPYPAEQFVQRESERQAWVAEVDGVVAGHVSHTVVPDDATGAIWSAGAGLPIDRLGCLSVLFVGPDHTSTGVGGRLLDTAVAEIRACGLRPVLDVTRTASNAASVYRHRGWQHVGDGRPDWLPDGAPEVEFFMLPDEVGVSRRAGTIVAGHGVASGISPTTEYPAGTIALQTPHFAARGLSLEGLRQATINLDLGTPVRMLRPTSTLVDVDWTDLHAPETFSFLRCAVEHVGRTVHGYVYWPHPETKPANFQADSVIELLLPNLAGLAYGDELTVTLPARGIA